jgi:hypothetical protein
MEHGLLDELTALQSGAEVTRPLTWPISELEILQIGRAIVSLTERTDLETCYRQTPDEKLIVWRRRKFAIQIGMELYSWREFVYHIQQLEPGRTINLRVKCFENVDETFREMLRVSITHDLRLADEANRQDITITVVDAARLTYTISALLATEVPHG